MASPVELAVIWTLKAAKGSAQWVDACTTCQLRAYTCCKKTKFFSVLVKIGLLGLAVFETPSWCLHDATPCADQREEDMVRTALPRLPANITNTFEILCLTFILLRQHLRRFSMGGARPCDSKKHFIGTVLVIVGMLDCFVAYVNIAGIFPGSFRIGRIIRPFTFLAFDKALRRTCERVLHSIPLFVDMLLSLAICVGVFVWFGLILFAKTKEGWDRFDSWQEGFSSMWVLFTTANFPDVMIPSLQQNEVHLAFWFFFAYLVVSLYLLNNILLAAVYDSYKKQLRTQLDLDDENRRIAVKSAFNLLAVDQHDGRGPVISVEEWTKFFTIYCRRSHGDWSQPAEQEFNATRSLTILRLAQLEHRSALSHIDFTSAIDVLFKLKICIPHTLPQRVPTSRFAQGLRLAVLRGIPMGRRVLQWNALWDMFIAMETVLLLGQTLVFVSPWAGGRFDNKPLKRNEPIYSVFFSFSCIYALEVCIRLFFQGRERLWVCKPYYHDRFDVFTVFSRLAAEFVFLGWPSGHFTPELRVLVVVRLFRSLRLLKRVKLLFRLGRVLRRLLPTYLQLSLLLLMIFYIYTTIGLQIFGGLIYKGNPALSHSTFEASRYWALNFNDFSSGMMTLFVLMVVNNWYVIADAFWRATGTMWSAVFFVSFFVVTNLVVLNILVALIIDCYATTGLQANTMVDVPNRMPAIPQNMEEELVQVSSGHLTNDSPEAGSWLRLSQRYESQATLRHVLSDSGLVQEAASRSGTVGNIAWGFPLLQQQHMQPQQQGQQQQLQERQQGSKSETVASMD